MPTIITHAAVPLLIGAAMGRRTISRPLLIAGTIAAMLPDTDVLAFKFGIAYGDAFGHRGASHSIVFALALGLLAAIAHRGLNSTARRSFLFVFLAALSHGLLDTFTNGGLGVALLWPFNDMRWFAPYTPIEVSPIGAARFFSERGWIVMRSEFCWVWIPTLVIALVIMAWRRMRMSEE